MNYLFATIFLYCLFVCGCSTTVNCQQQQQAQETQQDLLEPVNVPYYIQSPILNRLQPQPQPQPKVVENEQIVLNSQEFDDVNQRNIVFRPQKGASMATSTSRMLDMPLKLASNSDSIVVDPNSKLKHNKQGCLYDKRFFLKIDECMARKPYPTIGLPAFKNEDLLVKRGLSEKYGCVFILNNGLFKNYQISKYSIESDSSCLDAGGKVGLSLNFANVSLSYLWSLRCLNRADQLLDDATLNGRAFEDVYTESGQQNVGSNQKGGSICVGSSQNFGFASLQLSNIESQVELSTDIYNNWRITNVTVAMMTPNGPSYNSPTSKLESAGGDKLSENLNPYLGANIKDYTFESLDGDELNWRYLHLFQNWSRNRIHSNFLEQYRRFLWVSMQRCLTESTEKLPVKLHDVFSNLKYY